MPHTLAALDVYQSHRYELTASAMWTSAPLATRMETHSWCLFSAANIIAVLFLCLSQCQRKSHWITSSLLVNRKHKANATCLLLFNTRGQPTFNPHDLYELTTPTTLTSAPLATRIDTHSWWPSSEANIKAVPYCSSQK